MVKVIGVRFRVAGKIYFFSPGNLEIQQGDYVIVETARGVEYGRVVSGPKEVEEEAVVQPLKSVIRLATEQDLSLIHIFRAIRICLTRPEMGESPVSERRVDMAGSRVPRDTWNLVGRCGDHPVRLNTT